VKWKCGGDQLLAIDQGENAHRWFSKILNTKVRLVYQPDESHRPIGDQYKGPHNSVSLADRFPLLLLSKESLNDLNQRLLSPVAMARFRPNLVVYGCKPFEEDQWKRISIGSLEFDLVNQCIRCSIPSVDPETGKIDQEPLETLSNFRKQNGKVLFGQNAIPKSYGLIHVKDPLEVIKNR